MKDSGTSRFEKFLETRGIEPLTSWMPFKRSPIWATPPFRGFEIVEALFFVNIILSHTFELCSGDGRSEARFIRAQDIMRSKRSFAPKKYLQLAGRVFYFNQESCGQGLVCRIGKYNLQYISSILTDK